MKVLQFGKYYPPNVGGMERVSFNLTEGLNRRGIPCDVLCSNPNKVNSIEKWANYTVYRIKSFGELFSMAVTPGLIRWLRKLSRDRDIIHFHHPDPLAALSIFLTRPKSKIVIHWHLDIIKQKTSYALYQPLERWLLKRADAIIATSPGYAATSKPLRDYQHKCVAIPLGIDLPVRPDAKLAAAIKPKDKKVIFALGRFTEYKGFEHLVESAKYLDDSYLIWIGGGGPLRERYEQIIKEHNLSTRVQLLGKLSDEDVSLHFEACDVFCLPSVTRNEAFGLVILEAMGHNKPVVTTTVPGSAMSWINKHRETGMNVTPADANELAKAFKEMFADPAKLASMGEAARVRLNDFSVDKMVDSVVDLYKAL